MKLATGRFRVLGRCVDPAAKAIPIYLVAARDDRVVAPAQALAVRRLVGTRTLAVRSSVEPYGHLGLFMGRRTLANAWREIGR
jgi:poly(3-hydroxyalkanoate) synthetase